MFFFRFVLERRTIGAAPGASPSWAGSGTTLEEVNKLMASRKQMAKMMKQLGKGKLPTLPPGLAR